MTLQSTRFGTLTIAADAVIEFPNGLIGLPSRRYALIPSGHGVAFKWLHSADDPALAVPVIDPYQFFEGYKVSMSAEDAQRVGFPRPEDMTVWATIRVDGAREQFCANLRAPIAIAGGKGYQVLNHAHGASLKSPLGPLRVAAPRAA